jgi:hypothetical protein
MRITRPLCALRSHLGKLDRRRKIGQPRVPKVSRKQAPPRDRLRECRAHSAAWALPLRPGYRGPKGHRPLTPIWSIGQIARYVQYNCVLTARKKSISSWLHLQLLLEILNNHGFRLIDTCRLLGLIGGWGGAASARRATPCPKVQEFRECEDCRFRRPSASSVWSPDRNTRIQADHREGTSPAVLLQPLVHVPKPDCKTQVTTAPEFKVSSENKAQRPPDVVTTPTEHRDGALNCTTR